MIARIKEQPAVGKLIARYDQLPQRDRQALLLLGVALGLALLYLVVWQPITQFHDNARAERENAAELVAWMQANRPTIDRLAASGSNPSTSANRPEDGRALMSLVTRSATEAGLALQRFEPSGDAAIRVWMDNVPFADVAAWLEMLNGQHGVLIDQASLDRSDQPGRVSVRLTLAI
ncbi:MAG: general secretion pathway protein GspM [Marinobacter sp. 34-60-7]|nr:MAG: general secretion pathway protein GspM [Marinobacter sp. 34-60-7]